MIRLVMHANFKEDMNPCTQIVTPYCEDALHIAVTTRAPLQVLEDMVQDCPLAITTPDVYDLTPFDWLWLLILLRVGPSNVDVYCEPFQKTKVLCLSHNLDMEDL